MAIRVKDGTSRRQMRERAALSQRDLRHQWYYALARQRHPPLPSNGMTPPYPGSPWEPSSALA